MQKDKSITNFLKNIIFDQWRSAHARKLFCVKCLWGRSQPGLSTTKFGAARCIIINSSSGSLSVSLRKLCKVGNWRLIRIARISLTPPLNGFNCGAAGVQLARFENGWSIFSPKLAACGATSLFAWGVNRLHTFNGLANKCPFKDKQTPCNLVWKNHTVLVSTWVIPQIDLMMETKIYLGPRLF